MTPEQTAIVARGLSQLPLADRDRAEDYIASTLRPIRDLADSDVRHAVASALVKYTS